MKKMHLVSDMAVMLIFISLPLSAQVGINEDGNPPDQSAGLDVKFDNKGFLPPRMTFEQRNSIQNPVEGLIVFCTNCNADGTGLLSIYQGGVWKTLNLTCLSPNPPTAATHTPSVTQIVWNWNAPPITKGYKWNTVNNITTAVDIGATPSYTETGLTCFTAYNRYVWAYNDCGTSSASCQLSQSTSQVPIAAPVEATHVATLYQIVWNWNMVESATGYKWNSINDYNTAMDLGNTTSKTEFWVNCGAFNTRYVWSYNTCGISTATTLTQTAAACPENCLPITDTRDGKVYNTVLIGTQCWMKENLNVGLRINGSVNQTDNSTIEKYCYNNDEAKCNIYGGLYQWAETVQYLNGASNTGSWNPVPTGNVSGLCPTGWHLPSNSEWTTLTTYLGGTTAAGGKMKETGTSHWSSPNTGATNESGFTGLPGGYLVLGTGFYSLTQYNYFWSASEYTVTAAGILYLGYSTTQAIIANMNKPYGYSVRCLRD
jgi:uncharacterized protein (TIGR02145 family)